MRPMPGNAAERGYALSEVSCDALLREFRKDFRIFAPVRLEGRGRFSDTDMVRYGEIRNFREMELREKSLFSPKEVLFPPSETLFHFAETGVREPSLLREDGKGLLVLLRACDIAGVDRLDAIFLGNGPEKDPYYEARRKRVVFALIECGPLGASRSGSFGSCFCVSMGTNRASGYALVLRPEDDGLSLFLQDPAFAAYLPPDAVRTSYAPSFPLEDPFPVRVPDPGDMSRAVREESLFSAAFWKDYDSRCIACGRCNTVCPTCSCFTTYDVTYEENASAGERRRVWAGCHVDRFTDMAGGHRFREKYGARMRFKTMHKIHDFHLRFGRHMCVGCGRCDDACPEYISFAACIDRVSRVVDAAASTGGDDHDAR